MASVQPLREDHPPIGLLLVSDVDQQGAVWSEGRRRVASSCVVPIQTTEYCGFLMRSSMLIGHIQICKTCGKGADRTPLTDDAIWFEFAYRLIQTKCGLCAVVAV